MIGLALAQCIQQCDATGQQLADCILSCSQSMARAIGFSQQNTFINRKQAIASKTPHKMYACLDSFTLGY